MKKIISLIMVVLMVISILPMMVFAEELNQPVLTIESAEVSPGTSFDVNVNIKNNPGIISAVLRLTFDEGLTLVGAKNGNTFSTLSYTSPNQLINGGKITSGCQFMWSAADIADKDIKDGTIITLTFEMSDDAEIGDAYNIQIVSNRGDFLDKHLNEYVLSAQSTVTAVDYTPGDVNDDGVINMRDIVEISRYIVDGCQYDPDGYAVRVNENAANVNGDSSINMIDVVWMCRYIVDGCKTDPEGYNIKFVVVGKTCSHTLKATEEKEATCTEEGNIAYWQCTKCKKYFADENANSQITAEDIIVEAIGHTRVEIPAVEPTYDSYGSTAGVKCSTCGVVLTAPTPIDPLQRNETYVEFKYAEGDAYLNDYILEQTENGSQLFPKNIVYNTTHQSHYLPSFDLDDVPGYKFEGWFIDIAGVRKQVTEIEKGQIGSIKVYAKFTARTYTITYASDMAPIIDDSDEQFKTYKTNVGHEKLPTPQMDKYIFVGWSDKDGNMWNSIPKGTVGDLTLYANWSSHRNRAKAVKNLKDPIIVEDSKNGLILFTYEIGQIDRVPLFTLMKLNCANGIVTGNVRTTETSFGKDYAETAVETISNATTNSTSWTLEKNWNNSTEVSQKTLDETGYSETDAQKLSQSQTGTYNIGTSFGGSKTYTNDISGAYRLSANKAHSETNTTESGQEFGLSVDGKYSSETSTGIELGIPVEGLDLGINAGKKNSWEIGGGIDYSNYVKNTNSGTDSWSLDAEISGEKSKSFTNEKNWNTDVGFTNSQSTSIDEEVSKTISKLVSEEYGYGKSYAEGGSNSNAQAQETTDSKSKEFSSTLTYHTSEITSTTTSYTSTGNTIGDYRLIMAGTVRVFAVVGYDIAESSYFVYTYNVFDDTAMEEYLDYSYDGSFDDYETSIIPFEVPVFVNHYVNNRVAKTEGLAKFNYSTGEYEEYSNGSNASKIVSVPSYHIRENDDGTKTSYKVNGFKAETFQGNTNIIGVVLGHHITKIPDNAFAGCSSLKYIIAPGVTEIGDNAFSGCTSLSTFNVPYIATEWMCANAGCNAVLEMIDKPEKCTKCGHNVVQQLNNEVTIGTNAFLNVPNVQAKVTSVKTAQAVAASGARNIVLNISYIPKNQSDNLSLSVGNINTFELRGEGDTYRGFTLKSDAENTIINRVNVIEGKGTALSLSSKNVTLNGVDMSIDATACAMMLKSDHTNVIIKDTTHLSSNNDKALICKSVTFKALNTEDIAKIYVDGNMLISESKEEIFGEEYLVCDSIVEITASDFAKYEQGIVKLVFNANGGNVASTSKEVYYGDIVGEMPIPTRDYYTFSGWYTAASGGEKVTAETVMIKTEDVTLYAQWTLKPVSDWVKASAMPVGAQVTDTKWTYTLREYTESGSSSLSGWIKYDTKHTSWTAWGSWSPWQDSKVTASDSRQVETQQAIASTNTKTYYNYYSYRSVNADTGGEASYTSYNNCVYYRKIKLDYELPYGGQLRNNYLYNGWWYWKCDPYVTNEVVSYNYKTQYRYRDRSPVYTYYYYRDVNKEATSDPTNWSDTSNEIKWVKYRSK